MEQITIAGHQFNVPVKYAEGHELTQNEADALNQTYHENLRNNFAKRVKDGTEAGTSIEDLQKQLDEYAANYEFGVRTGGGGGPRDPVQSEAMNIARQIIRNALKKKGKKLNEVEASAINDAAKRLIADPERGAPILEQARARVAEMQQAASVDLGDLVSSIPAKPEGEAAPAQQ